MSLFPAYSDGGGDIAEAKLLIVDGGDGASAGDGGSTGEVSPGGEARLLASDDEPEPPPRVARRSQLDSTHFYLDNKFDPGNLRVSTLYYPGRPQYNVEGRVVGKKRKRESDLERAPRYWQRHIPPADDSAELAERLQELVRRVKAEPHDAHHWLPYIRHMEEWRDTETTLVIAERAVHSCRPGAGAGGWGRPPGGHWVPYRGVGPGGGGARLVRAALYRARLAHLDMHSLLRTLREDATKAMSEERRAEAWFRVVATALGRGGAAEGERALHDALGALRPLAAHYAHLLYLYGSYLCNAGLSEQLVLLIELVTEMNLSPSGFPPVPDPVSAINVRKTLVEFEKKTVASSLPRHVVWARLERARATAHWRPAPLPQGGGARLEADPQRYPVPADLADMLVPLTYPPQIFMLCVNLLRLAKVPLLPVSEYVLSACGGGGGGQGWGGTWLETAPCAGAAEGVLGAVLAARRLPAARRPSRSTAAALLRLLVDPPHYLPAYLAEEVEAGHEAGDAAGFGAGRGAGYEEWVSALWEACLARLDGPHRTALLCWRLRWMHAISLLLDTQSSEHARVVREAHAAVERWGGDEPLPCLLLARLQPRRLARAVRAVLAHPASAPAHRLYAARLGGGREDLCRAVLGDSHDLDTTLAYEQCKKQCTELEKKWLDETEKVEDGRGLHVGRPWEALGLHEGSEWGAARVRLASPSHLADILADILHYTTLHDKTSEFSRYCEQTACALVGAEWGGAGRGRNVAAQLAAHFPHNQYIQLCAVGQWPRVVSPAASVARLLPTMSAALGAGWAPGDAARVQAACGAGTDPVSCACRLEAAARAGAAGAGAVSRAAVLSLERFPDHKWLYVRAGRWGGGGGGGAEELADAALDRGLRLYTLLDELDIKPYI